MILSGSDAARAICRFRTRPVSQSDAQQFEGYAYEAPYDIYDSAAGSAAVFREASHAYVAVVDGSEALWGFGCAGAEAQVPGGRSGKELGVLDVGVGMAPGRVGAGSGRAFCSAVLAYASGLAGATVAEPQFRVSVAAFNVRSLRVWEALGFRETHRFDHRRTAMPFIELVVAVAAMGRPGAA